MARSLSAYRSRPGPGSVENYYGWFDKIGVGAPISPAISLSIRPRRKPGGGGFAATTGLGAEYRDLRSSGAIPSSSRGSDGPQKGGVLSYSAGSAKQTCGPVLNSTLIHTMRSRTWSFPIQRTAWRKASGIIAEGRISAKKYVTQPFAWMEITEGIRGGTKYGARVRC